MKKSLIILAVLLAPICAWAQDEAQEPQKVAEAPTPTIVAYIGDANGDGNIDLLDASLIVDYWLGKSVSFSRAMTYVDVNGDNEVNLLDASLVVDFWLGKITEFPVAQKYQK